MHLTLPSLLAFLSNPFASSPSCTSYPSYPPDGATAFIPFTLVTGKLFPHDNAFLQFNVTTPYASDSQFTAAMDTGSTGLAFSANLLGLEGQSLDALTPGKEYLSSSGVLWEGYWINASIAFAGGVRAEVPVLAVTNSSICKNFSEGTCFEKTDVREWPGNVSYCGVGFGRGSSQQPQALPDKVPFVNVVEIDGMDIQGSIRQGYVLNRTGITVGLTQENAEHFAMAKLDLRNDPTCLVDCDRDWQMVDMHISIGDSVVDHGKALFDTGIHQSYVTVGEWIYDTLDLEPLGKSWILANGSMVTVTVGEKTSPIATYVVKVNDPDSPLNPYEGEFIVSKLPLKSTRVPFINTGRYFYKGFEAMLDADCGWFGLREVSIEEVATEVGQHVEL